LWPPCMQPRAGLHGGSRSNNASVVLKLVYGEVSFLFTGDAETGSEIPMIRAWGGFLRSTVLKVAHHGSRSGTSAEFLEAVRPSIALLSVGLHNSFGHPSPELLQRLERAHVRVRRTDREGAVILTSDGRSVREISWRQPFP
ncbi:MAG TPA: hypothetical protein VMF59_11175, partial [Bacteroidota bacterium]|nr:hypothetical protein [Bacteroidota bacterium]